MFYLSDSRFPWILASAGLQQLFSQWTSVDLLPVDRWVTTFFSARLQAPSRFPFSHWFTYQAPVFPGSLLQPGVTTFCSAGLQLFAQHTQRLSCAFPSEWFQHLNCDSRHFVWSGLPPELVPTLGCHLAATTSHLSCAFPLGLLDCDPVCDPLWVIPTPELCSHHSAQSGLPSELVPSLGCRLAVTLLFVTPGPFS